MITNFEEITTELTPQELKLIPLLIDGFSRRDKNNPINSGTVCTNLNIYLQRNKMEIRITDERLRKCVNYIRANGIHPVIATSKGYYSSFDKEELTKQIKSLNERANSILNSAKGLEKILNKI